MAPPGLPPERLNTLRRAFDATLKDPAVLAEAKKLGMEINPVSGREVEALVVKMMNTPDALAQRARDALKPPRQ
jgi:tripartite-type tricarboxylate transporter receptor subunit TctC